jgi:hypothetical protein
MGFHDPSLQEVQDPLFQDQMILLYHATQQDQTHLYLFQVLRILCSPLC